MGFCFGNLRCTCSPRRSNGLAADAGGGWVTGCNRPKVVVPSQKQLLEGVYESMADSLYICK